MTGVWRSSRSVVVGIVDPHAPWYNIVNTQRPPGRADPQPSNIGRAAPLRGKCQIAGLGRSLAPRGDKDPVGLSWSLRRRGVRANPTPGATADTLLSRSLASSLTLAAPCGASPSLQAGNLLPRSHVLFF